MPNDFDQNANADASRLVPMGELDDYEVAEGYPDVRGWAVVGEDSRKLGVIRELIVDTGAMRTRYLDVTLDPSVAGGSEARNVLVPIGNANLDAQSDYVILDAAIAARLASLPAYIHGRLTREYENRLLPALGSTPVAGADFYAGRHFDDSRFLAGRRRDRREASEARVTRSEEELTFEKRQVEAGEVDIDKTVHSEHVSQRVPFSREDVTIDRHAVPADRAPKADIREEHVRVPFKTEEVVVEKRPVVKEEVVIKKHAVDDSTIVEADVKKEQLNVERRAKRTEKDTRRDSDAR